MCFLNYVCVFCNYVCTVGGERLPIKPVVVPNESTLAPFLNATEEKYCYVSHRPEAVTSLEKEKVRGDKCCCRPATVEHRELAITDNRVLVSGDWKTYHHSKIGQDPALSHAYYCMVVPLTQVSTTRVEETYPVYEIGSCCCPGVLCCPATGLDRNFSHKVPGAVIYLSQSLSPFRTHFENVVDNPQLHEAIVAISTHVLMKSQKLKDAAMEGTDLDIHGVKVEV